MSTVHITGQTILKVRRLTIKGVDPDNLIYTIREFVNSEGTFYEVEHIPTKTKVDTPASHGLGAAIEACAEAW